MNIIDAIILGSVQGLTEFLPISSSGHLVIGQHLLSLSLPGHVFEVLVHLGTLCSIFVVFYKDIKSLLTSLDSQKTQRFILLIVTATLPAVAIGLSMKNLYAFLFESVMAVGGSLIFTGLVLIGTALVKIRHKNHSFITAVIIGGAQALAIIPGISRSGMTISAALLLGLSAKEAARFSFLLAIPAISGAGLLTALGASSGFNLPFSISFAAFISSFGVGVVALRWLLKWLEQGKFYYFGVYCVVVGLVTLVV